LRVEIDAVDAAGGPVGATTWTMKPETSGAMFHDAGHGWDVFGLHPPSLRRALELGEPLYRRWFRVRSHEAAHVPATGPVIVVANHSGALPIDAVMLCLDLLHHTGRIPRVIADRFVPHLPFIGTLFSRLGVVIGTLANVRALLAQGELVVIFPEGAAGIGKPFRERYELQEWRVGHAELALRHRASVVPVAIIGAEESWPVLGRIRKVHPFGAPFLPVPALPFPLPMPIHVHYGHPLVLHDEVPHLDPDEPDDVAHASSLVRCALEDLIRDARVPAAWRT
jgi:1-acyl-sn-glycerol-3-phosphate acyltransferase